MIIQAQALGLHTKEKQILNNLNFEIQRGRFTVVVGENGAGKTSLLKLLMGYIRPSTGKLRVLGNDPAFDPSPDRERIAYLSESLSPPIDWSVREFLRFNSFFYKNYSPTIETKLLANLGIDPKSRIGQLSTGETRRVQIIAALSFEPKLVIIDEVTAVLDIVGRGKFMELLKTLTTSNSCTVVMATNIIDDVELYADDILILHRGLQVSYSNKEELKKTSNEGLLTQAIAKLISEPDQK